MDRKELTDKVAAMVADGHTAEEIVDAVIAALTPDDDEECPVCGICP